MASYRHSCLKLDCSYYCAPIFYVYLFITFGGACEGIQTTIVYQNIGLSSRREREIMILLLLFNHFSSIQIGIRMPVTFVLNTIVSCNVSQITSFAFWICVLSPKNDICCLHAGTYRSKIKSNQIHWAHHVT